MTLSDALNLPEQGRISLVGGGGKSTLMLRLARQLAQQGQRVVVTTTTHILRQQGEEAGPLLSSGGGGALNTAFHVHPVVCLASPALQPGKLTAPPEKLLHAASAQAHWVIAEADGARCCPVKAPGAHEPVLLEDSLVIAVAGLSSLGNSLHQICYRWELACQVLDVPGDTLLTPQLLARLITSEQGQYKGVDDLAHFRVVLNQGDNPEALALGRETAAIIQDNLPGCRVVLPALRDRNCVKEVISSC